MPIEVYTTISYADVYDDIDKVTVSNLISTIPSIMALKLICHYSAKIHTVEIDYECQKKIMADWYINFPITVRQNIDAKMSSSGFNFFNNVSSLLLIEKILENYNNFPERSTLSAVEEESLFKAYLLMSHEWTDKQATAIKKYPDSLSKMSLVIQLPFQEVLEFKDFRIQFIKAVYFFRFCEQDELFMNYLTVFLQEKGVKSWQQYLFHILSVYVSIYNGQITSAVVSFSKYSLDVFNALKLICTNPTTFKPATDFLTLRKKPLFFLGGTDLMFMSINFFIDKIYHSILFDFAEVLIKSKQTYKGKLIDSPPKFFGIFGDEFIEPGLLYKLFSTIFKKRDFVHFSGANLKAQIGDGTPDYLIVDNCKIYVFEFKNAIVSGAAKYSMDIDQIIIELRKKFVENEKGRPKGITQLVNFLDDFSNGRYQKIVDKNKESYIIYPILVTTDYSINLPVIYTLLNDMFKEKAAVKYPFSLSKFTVIDLDSLIKFQDFFIAGKFSINHVLQDYQRYLLAGTNPIDKSLSFNKYLHDKTIRDHASAPKAFWDGIENLQLILGNT